MGDKEMSREIEFRVWDNYHNCYLLEDGEYLTDIYHVFDEKFKPRKDYILEQFTGLTDCNGVKIFEGDIVECKIRLWPDMIEYIEIRLANMTCDILAGEYGGGQDFEETIVESKVIGNIHQNPELLERTNANHN